MNYKKDRVVLCEDAIKWLEESHEQFHGSIFCGIPDMYDVYDLLSPSSSSLTTSLNEGGENLSILTSTTTTTTLETILEITKTTTPIGLEIKAIEYKKWFIKTINLIYQRLSPGQCVIFTQTDTKILNHSGEVLYWMDKSYLCIAEAEKNNCNLLWHKIAIDDQAEISSYRPCYTHLLCFGKSFSYHTSKFQSSDVINRGLMTWEKAIGLEKLQKSGK